MKDNEQDGCEEAQALRGWFTFAMVGEYGGPRLRLRRDRGLRNFRSRLLAQVRHVVAADALRLVSFFALAHVLRYRVAAAFRGNRVRASVRRCHMRVVRSRADPRGCSVGEQTADEEQHPTDAYTDRGDDDAKDHAGPETVWEGAGLARE